MRGTDTQNNERQGRKRRDFLLPFLPSFLSYYAQQSMNEREGNGGDFPLEKKQSVRVVFATACGARASCRSCFGLAELSLVVTQPGSEISLRSGGLGGGEHVGKERKSQMVVIRYESQRGVTQPSPPPLPLPLFPVFSFHIPF